MNPSDYSDNGVGGLRVGEESGPLRTSGPASFSEYSKESLVIAILHWWKDAQYWEENGYNVFTLEPEFVKQALAIAGPTSSAKILNPWLSNDEILRLYG